MLKSAFSSVLFATAAQASFHMGGCPAFTDMGADFDITKYTGKWYEVARDKFTHFEILSGCVQADYGLKDDGSISISNKAHRFLLGWDSIEGSGVQSNVTGPASLNVNFFGEPSADEPGNYFVINTDYDNYSIVYNCREYLGG